MKHEYADSDGNLISIGDLVQYKADVNSKGISIGGKGYIVEKNKKLFIEEQTINGIQHIPLDKYAKYSRRKKNILKKNVFEIGVGDPSLCRTRKHMSLGDNVSMFEANPETCKKLLNTFGRFKNVKIYNLALYDKDTTISFVLDGDSSYVDEINSPTKHNQDLQHIEKLKKIDVNARTLKHFDKGDINIIYMDVEGCEWKILSTLISRPEKIIIETHNKNIINKNGSHYETPNLHLIKSWMNKNNYILEKEVNEDSYYIKKEPVKTKLISYWNNFLNFLVIDE